MAIKLLDVFHYNDMGVPMYFGQIAIDSEKRDVEAEILNGHHFHPGIINPTTDPVAKDLLKASLVDCVPDDWGKAIISIINQLPKAGMHDLDYLPYLNQVDMVIGGAVFIEHGKKLPPRIKPPVLSKAVAGDASRIDNVEKMDGVNLALLIAMGAPPGIRPKALVEYNGKPCLAKFESRHDNYDVLGAEFLCMRLAEACGIEVPEYHLDNISGKKVLVQSRFDIPEGKADGRYPVISFRALSGLTVFAREDYTELAKICRRYSDNVVNDSHYLFERMVFNVVTGNTEDHHRNFSMIDYGHGWQLSPAYDLTVSYAQEMAALPFRMHAQNFMGHQAPSLDVLVKLHKNFGLTKTDAASIINNIVKTVKTELPKQIECVDERDREMIAAVISQGVQLLDKKKAPKKTPMQIEKPSLNLGDYGL